MLAKPEENGAAINAAFAASGGFAANAAACDPMLLPAGQFAGKRILCTASPGDTIVTKAANADAFIAKVAGVAASAAVIATTGDHGDVSNWNTAIATQMLAHFNG